MTNDPLAVLALRDGDQYGYGLMHRVEERTGGDVRMGPGTLYGAIKRMLADGLIEESDGRPDPASTTSAFVIAIVMMVIGILTGLVHRVGRRHATS